MSEFTWFILFTASFLMTYLLTPLIAKFAIHIKAVDIPNQRKVHTIPKPRIGGIAIFFSFLISVYGIGYRFLDIADKEEVFVIVTAGIIVFFMGLIDDLKPLSARLKFAVQIGIAILLVYRGVRITMFVSHPMFAYIVTILWIVGITNSFNLLDNMDGLSSGVAIISSVFFFLVAVSQQETVSALLSICLAGSILGFLRYNFNPSTIFMGDCGSTFIGYTLSAIAISGTYVTTTKLRHLPVIIPLLILSVAIFDTFSVIIIRIKKGVSIFKADKNHFSHRLVQLGLSHRAAVLFIYLVAVCVGMNSMLITTINRFQAIIILLQSIIIFVIIVLLMLVSRNLVIQKQRKEKREKHEQKNET